MLTIYTLEEGVVYTVTKPFTDYHQNKFAPGDKLTYAGRAFLPYHGGHTLFFKERCIYLQENDDVAIIDAFHAYLTLTDVSGRVDPSQRTPAPLIPRARRKGYYYFVAFFILCGIALWLVFYGPARPVWLPLTPVGVALLVLIAAAIAEWRHPV
jgi:hypothetical protein